MGWASKLVVGSLGFLLIGGPLWPVAVVCFLYLAIAFRPKRPPASPGSHPSSSLHGRHFLAFALFLLSAVALALGGTLSPFVFLLGGAVVLVWPVLPALRPTGEAIPVGNSIMLRSRYFPLAWHSLAELKPGSESFTRALSSFSGTLMVFTETGRTYALATCLALGRKDAETELNRRLKSIAPGPRAGAFLLPLDSEAAAGVLRQRVSRVRLPTEDFGKSASRVPGVLVLECLETVVRKAGAYEIDGPGPSVRVPSPGSRLDSPPLLWEVLDEVGKRTRWPDPDSFSGLLDSLVATKGAPLSERLRALEISGEDVTVQSLGGAEVHVTRPQLRALISIYS